MFLPLLVVEPPVLVPPVLVLVSPPGELLLPVLPPVEPVLLDPVELELPVLELPDDELNELVPAEDAKSATSLLIAVLVDCPSSHVAITMPPPMIASSKAYSAAVAPLSS